MSQSATMETASGPFGWSHRTLTCVFVFVLTAASFFYFARQANWNVNSRLALVFSVVDDGRLDIDKYHADGPLATGDKSFNGGHYYCDKAIGTSVLGVIAYAPVSAGDVLASPARFYLTRHWITFFSVGLPIALVLAYFFVVLDKLLGERRRALAITLTFGLATPLWPFATLLFGHALVAALLLGAFLMVLDRRVDPRAWSMGARALFGVLLGFAVITEYTSAPVVLLIGLYYLIDAGKRGELARLSTWIVPFLGAVPWVGLQLAYNAAAFGSPFSLGYANIADPYFREIHAHGLLGVSAPDLSVLYYITLHPVRGIFVHAPILAAGLVGLVLAAFNRRLHLEAVFALAAIAVFFAINAGFGVWWGGYSFTARHLVPAMGFLMLGLAFLPRRAWPVVLVLALISLVQIFVAVIGDPVTSDVELIALLKESIDAPAQLGSPIWSQIWPALNASPPLFSPNMGGMLGLSGYASVVPYFGVVAALAGAYVVLGRRYASPVG